MCAVEAIRKFRSDSSSRPSLKFGGSFHMPHLTNVIRNGPRLLAVASGIVVCSVAAAQNVPSVVVAMTPNEMEWRAQGGLTVPGLEQLNLVGDPAKAGTY